MPRNLLFSEHALSDVVESQLRALLKDIESYDSNRLLNTSSEDLVTYFVEKYRINPIVLDEEGICVEQEEAKVDVRYDRNRLIFDRSKPVYVTGTAITFEIPFEGDQGLFKCRPSSFTFSPPFGEVRNNRLVIKLHTTKHDLDKISGEFNSNLTEIKRYLSAIIRDVQGWNNNLEDKIRGKVAARKDKLLKDRELVASLGFKMKKTESEMLTYVAADVRRKLPPKAPAASTDPYVPEPTLDMGDYEHILEIMKMTAKMLERSPQAFRGMGEEHLRDQFLVPLNSHYEGQASGETFNFNGKTDIFIHVDGKAIFIAECKIWRGQKAFLEAIDQLLGYTTWRDTKNAVIVFNRNKDFSGVLASIEQAVPTHRNYKRLIRKISETEFRYIFGHRDDVNREMILTVLAFEVPA